MNVWLVLLFLMPGNPLALVVVSLVFVVVVSAFVIPGVLLWGRKRWAVVLGTLLAIVGGMMFFTSLMFYQISSMDVFRDHFAMLDPAFMEKTIRGSLLLGIAAAVAGALFIARQRIHDKAPDSTVAMS